jgi:serine/threonine protein kinase
LATAALLQSGDLIGGFRVDDVIGIGGMAIVYRAEQVSLGRPVALKVLASKLSRDDLFRERFRREAAHAAALEHPNIVPVYDYGEQDRNLYIAMRLVEGTHLAELIQTRGLTADETIEILRPIASALDTAHAAGLIHRDIKPQNVLITAHGHPYLADFGVAKGSNTQGLTATGGFVGSVHYASPEQIRGLTLTPASDVYALTAVLYQCLTGQLPFPRETDAGVMHAHLHDPPPTLPTSGNDGASSELHTVIARGMAKDPGARYRHAGDLLTASELCVARLPVQPRKTAPAFPNPTEPAEPLAVHPAGKTEIVTGEELAATRPSAESEPFTAADRRRPASSEQPEHDLPASRRRTVLIACVVAALLITVLGVLLLMASSSGTRTKAGNAHVGDQGPAAHVESELSRALASRARAVTTSSTRIHRAPLSARAGGLKSVAIADEEAARSLNTITAPPHDATALAALVHGLTQEAARLRSASAAARQKRASLYDSLRERLTTAPISAFAANLAAVGYKGLPLPPIDIPRAPIPPGHHHHRYRHTATHASTPSTHSQSAASSQPSQPAYTQPPASTPAPAISEPSPAQHKEPEVVTSKPE